MVNRCFRGRTPIAIVSVFCLAVVLVRSELVDSSTTASEPGLGTIIQDTETEAFYLGSDACFTCHRTQGGSWSETKHAKAFDNLPEKYRTDLSCLKCHVTAFGESGGFTAGMSAADAKPFQHVGCESCHGPGSRHAAGVQRWMQADPADEERMMKEMKAAIRKSPPDSVCAACHQAQAHKAHPPYEGQPSQSLLARVMNTGTRISLPPTPDSYSVKTCASCHYEQYQSWRVGHHIGLSSKIPEKYETDKSCLECHRNSQDRTEWFTATSDSQADSPVGCESCHGSGFKHVKFNKRYISAPPLSPDLEKVARDSITGGKPPAACSNCHIQLAHKEHPKYEKPEAAEKPAEKSESAK
jgi:hypothetical protein